MGEQGRERIGVKFHLTSSKDADVEGENHQSNMNFQKGKQRRGEKNQPIREKGIGGSTIRRGGHVRYFRRSGK